MTRTAKLYARIRSGGRPSFQELRRLAEAFGFELKRIEGSHHVFRHPGIPGILNFQPDGKDAKPYQVRQFLAMIDENGLELDDA